jgi:DNA-binding CsgD family transcriptional regulator
VTSRNKRGQQPTRLEIDLLNELSLGITCQEAAARLYVGLSAVKECLRSIYQKLGANNRTHAVLLAYEAGWIGKGTAESRSDRRQAVTTISEVNALLQRIDDAFYIITEQMSAIVQARAELKMISYLVAAADKTSPNIAGPTTPTAWVVQNQAP